jgi:hypothetical protein
LSKVWSTELPQNILSSANAQNQQVAFDATKSSTFKKIDGASWKISYGDGSSASGDVGTDIIDLGGLKVENQAVELAKQLSQQFAEVYAFCAMFLSSYADCTIIGQRQWPSRSGL